ncbi:MAG: ATP phosphoribosyltransferase [Atopobiaceae bacterium]|nr:ATP phosphoribosyltransferase [Atopobiaceae bacterium]
MAGTPRGFRDILPSEALTREELSERVRKVFSARGYLPVETPFMEDVDILERAGRIKGSPFRLFDSDGRLLMLRPDLTTPVARLVTTRLANAPRPLRLRYAAPVVRERQSLRGQPRQFTQLGIELIGGDGVASEVEVLELLGEAFEAAGIADWRIVCGSVVPFTALLESRAPSKDFADEALALVHSSDLVGLDALVDAALEDGGLDADVAVAIKRLPRIQDGAAALDEAEALLASARIPADASGMDTLREIVGRLEGSPVGARLAFDFSIVNSFDYYTGIIFRGYAAGVTAAVASGGRYDAVLASFGEPDTCACGFAISLELLQEAVGSSADPSGNQAAGTRPLRIAIPKGSLFADTVALVERAGLDVSDLREPGRHLVIPAGDVEFIIVRAADAPAFVGAGGADCGFCGSDSIIEAGIDLVQLVDCRYGACRFIVAEPASAQGKAEAAYAWRGTMRVATKYPRITQAYYDSIGQQVDILALHGNIELGPIVGMADRIVDITATGSTLRENDLVVVDDVMECSARFFASPAAYRCDPRVRALADMLQACVEEGTR